MLPGGCVDMPKSVDHSERRRDFVKAAYDTLLKEGLAATTLRRVAKNAGYTTGALVHYFADKDELIRHAMEENGKRVRERMEQVAKQNQGRDALRGLAVEALPVDGATSMGFRLWLALWYHSEASEDMRAEERRRYKEWHTRIKAAFQQSVELGELSKSTDVTEEARIYVAMLDGLGIQALMARGKPSTKRVIGAVDRYLARVFGNPPRKRP